MKIKSMFWLGAALCALASCGGPSVTVKKEIEKSPETIQKEREERGEYLVGIMGCHDCHSPKIMGPKGPEPDPNRILSGHPADVPLPAYDKAILKDYVLFNMSNTAFIGPWGVSYAANLTPDESGLGSWTEEQFIMALTKGKFKGTEGSRNLLPPMPWQAYAAMSAEDAKSIFAYLKTVKPVKNIVPQAEINPPPPAM